MFNDYITDPSVLCGAERLCVLGGKAKGMELIRVYNGKLSFYLNADRCLDIYRLEYGGKLVSYISKNGLVNPALIGEAYAYKNVFNGGFVYTCGLDNAGVPFDDGNAHVQHGAISYIPAEDICISGGFEGEDYYVTVAGTAKFTGLFDSCLYMRRTVRVKYMGDEIELKDEITNMNATDDKYIIQYHCNFGYPFIDKDARLSVAASQSHGLTGSENLADCFSMCAPKIGCGEECFLHTLKGGKGAHARITGTDLAVELCFDADVQPYILQWKYPSAGDYALGVEPTTARSPEKTFTKICAGETKTHGVTFKFIQSHR